MVDIGSREKETNLVPVVVIIAAIVLGFIFAGSDRPQDIPPVNLPDAALIIDASGIANSTLVDQWAADREIELRRLNSDSQLTNAEDWVKLLHSHGKDRSPCVVISHGNEITIVPITHDLINAIDSVRR